ncbi:hypothetical protein C8A00DRAFT_40076 [Chaetomidium leptoderma]|uniref:F-box domain-containing protein n=1 Tax=Chaetomidium leptoderma TaxID=669021 RepID=A0AAN6VTH0_9PEZI|nr:hypothetical protein C8A00DRAFT_40076 [Chaetomidium leptoderma]
MAILHQPVDERKILPAQARSNEPYPAGDTDDRNAIIQVVTFHRRDYNLALVSFGPQSSSFIRTLDRLPCEINCETIRYLDAASVIAFRQANRHARQVVSTLPEYQAATQHAMDAILALYKIGIAAHFTPADIQTVLSIEKCPLCGEFGGFIFLPTLQRCCFPCLQLSPELRVYRARKCKNVGGPVPVARSIPGTFGMAETECKQRLWLTPTKPMAKSNPKPIYRYMVATALPYVDLGAGGTQVQHGVCCTGCQISVEKNLAMHGDVPSYDISDLRDRVYSSDGYLRHFQWCQEAQTLWASSSGGTVPVKIPFGALKGGSFRSSKDG